MLCFMLFCIFGPCLFPLVSNNWANRGGVLIIWFRAVQNVNWDCMNTLWWVAYGCVFPFVTLCNFSSSSYWTRRCTPEATASAPGLWSLPIVF